MSRKRHAIHVDTFPFLAVLLCAMGSLILLLLVFDQRAKVVARAKAQEHAADAAARKAKAVAADNEDWQRKVRQLHDLLIRQQLDLQNQLRAILGNKAATVKRLQEEEGEILSLHKAIGAQKADLDKKRTELAVRRGILSKASERERAAQKDLERFARELDQLERTLRDLQAVKRRQKETYSLVPYHGRHGSNRKPIYVEVIGDSLVFHPGGKSFSPLTMNPGEFLGEIVRQGGVLPSGAHAPGSPGADANKEPDTAYVLFLIRPSGITTYYQAQAAMKELHLDYGYEFVEGDWVFDFGGEGNVTSQPWQSAGNGPKGSGDYGPRSLGTGPGGSGSGAGQGFGPGSGGGPGNGAGSGPFTLGQGGTGFGPGGPGNGNGGPGGGNGVSGTGGGRPNGGGSGAGQGTGIGLWPGAGGSGVSGSGPGWPGGGGPGVPGTGPGTGNGFGPGIGGGGIGIGGTGQGGSGIRGQGNGSGWPNGGGSGVPGTGPGTGNGFGPGIGGGGIGIGGTGQGGSGIPGQGNGSGWPNGGGSGVPGTGPGTGNGSGPGIGGGGIGIPGTGQGGSGIPGQGSGGGWTNGGGIAAGPGGGSGVSGSGQGTGWPIGGTAAGPGGGSGTAGNGGGQATQGTAQGGGGQVNGAGQGSSQNRVGSASANGGSGVAVANTGPWQPSSGVSGSTGGGNQNSPSNGAGPVLGNPSPFPVASNSNRGQNQSQQPDESDLERQRRLYQPGGGGGDGGGGGGMAIPLGQASPLANLQKPGKSTRPNVPLGRLIGNRDFFVVLECTADAVIIQPWGTRFPLATLPKEPDPSHPLVRTVQQLINRRQATVLPGETPYRPILRFTIRPDGLRAYYLAYPLLEELHLTMTRENLDSP